MLEKLLYNIGLFYTKVRFFRQKDQVQNFSAILYENSKILVIMPFELGQFDEAKIAILKIKNEWQKLHISLIVRADYLTYSGLAGNFNVFILTQKNINSFFIPKRKFLKPITNSDYDIVIDFNKSMELTSSFIAKKINVKYRVSFIKEYVDRFFNVQFNQDSVLDNKNIYLTLMDKLKMFCGKEVPKPTQEISETEKKIPKSKRKTKTSEPEKKIAETKENNGTKRTDDVKENLPEEHKIDEETKTIVEENKIDEVDNTEDQNAHSGFINKLKMFFSKNNPKKDEEAGGETESETDNNETANTETENEINTDEITDIVTEDETVNNKITDTVIEKETENSVQKNDIIENNEFDNENNQTDKIERTNIKEENENKKLSKRKRSKPKGSGKKN